MRKILCLVLVLVFCVSMACPAMAFTGSHEGGCNHDHCNCTDDCICNNGQDCGCDCYDHNHGGLWNPKTGDIIMMWVAIMVLALIALAAAVVIYRKKFSN